MADYVKVKKAKKDDVPQKKSRFSFKMFLILLIVFLALSSIISSVTLSLTPKIAIIPIEGVILTDAGGSLLGGDSTSSREIATKLLKAKDDESIKAVLLDINSPGGSPVASEEISEAIIDVREAGKPVYALFNDVGASGAFWIGVTAEKVYASSMSTLGSIGVTSAGLSFEDFIADYNVTYRRLTAGEYKDIGSPFREMTDSEKDMIQEILNEVHANFIVHVANARNMNVDTVEEYADGRWFLGSTALEAGFIDEIGYYPDVIAELKEIAGNDSLVVDYGPAPTLAEELGFGSFGTIFPGTDSKILLK